MVPTNEACYPIIQGIEERTWSLKEIQEAYRGILVSYAELFPVHPEPRKSREEEYGNSEDIL